jgi:hypothetical protein
MGEAGMRSTVRHERSKAIAAIGARLNFARFS